MKAIIVAVGNELTSGQTVDTNSAYLARQLVARGIETVGQCIVPDDRGAIAAALRDSAAAADLVLVTGGLGPTADDLTRHALADAMGAELVLDGEALATLEAFFRRRGRTMVPANRVQAMFPAGARPIENQAGTAQGIAARLGGADVYITPGVPHEMRWIFENRIAGELPAASNVIVERVVHAFGTGESNMAAEIADLMRRGANPTVGTTVSAGLISIRISARADVADEAESLAQRSVAEVKARLGEWVVGEGDATIASTVGDLLRRAGATLATAESCTGGLLGAMITDVPGASDYYAGGVVSYANDVKRDALGVPEELLRSHGAVSEPVAKAMAVGVRQRLGSDYAVAVTGIAGPSGGTDAKPVGLVHIALAGPEGVTAHRHIFPGDRPAVRRRSATAALNHLRLELLAREATR
jgi:nicotinamide-nucleotide amidase